MTVSFVFPYGLERLERSLRDAAACRRFSDAARLAVEFSEAVREYAQSLPQGDPRAIEAGRRLDGVLSWVLLMLQAARGACAVELRRVTTANRYRSGCDEPAHNSAMHLDA